MRCSCSALCGSTTPIRETNNKGTTAVSRNNSGCLRGASTRSRRDVRRHSSYFKGGNLGKKVFDFISEQLDYDSWAPRSARAWRLGEVPTEVETKGDEIDELITNLQEKVREQTRYDEESFEKGALDGKQLKEMMIRKYGVLYDMNFKCVSLPMKRVLSLNIMWSYYGQKSFPMTEEQYELKLDGLAQLVRQLNKEGVVRDFFAKEPKAERGLPARPTVGTAVIIRFTDLDDAVINEYFK